MYYLEIYSPLSVNAYRLQNDRTWRCIKSDEPIKATDYTTASSDEIVSLRMDDNDVFLDGQRSWISQAGFDDNDGIGVFYYDAYVIRTEKPRRPSFDQMIEAIAAADVSKSNWLVLLVDGQFAIRPTDDRGVVRKDPSIAAWHSGLAWHLLYFRQQAVKGVDQYRRWYYDSLETWIHHLRTGRCNLYVDILNPRKPDEIERELAELA